MPQRCGCQETALPRDPIIEPDALPSLGAFRLLDVREPVAFEAGHPAKAVRVPIETWEAAAKAGETSFENITYWEHAISALGVDAQVPAVVYDDGRMIEAARVWFILQYDAAVDKDSLKGAVSLQRSRKPSPTIGRS